jgi:hypothetical protein
MTPKRQKPNAKTEEARTEQGRKNKPERLFLEAEKGRINKFNKRIWPKSFKEQSRTGGSLKKPLTNYHIGLIDIFDFL